MHVQQKNEQEIKKELIVIKKIKENILEQEKNNRTLEGEK
jgi:hypothetical protein